MVFNATLNNISVLLVEEIGVPGENHQPATSHGQTLSHNVVSNTPHLTYYTIMPEGKQDTIFIDSNSANINCK